MQKLFMTYPSNLKPSLSQNARLLSMITAFLLSGCMSQSMASNPTPLLDNKHSIAQSAHHSPHKHSIHSPLIHFEVHGKLGFSDGKKGGSANFMWIEDGKNFDIRLYGPFGAGAVWIQSINGEILLTDGEGKTFNGKTPETVLKKVTGWDIPVSGLRYWLKGTPAPHSKVKNATYLKTTPNPLLETFSQDGWSIHYQGYRQVKNQWVPKALVLQRGKIRLKVIFKHWDL